jgi:hypothetical protein
MTLRPRFDGGNIRAWIGFKQILALVEESVVDWCRQMGAGPRRLYQHHGLELELLDVSAQLTALVELDDELEATVTPRQGNRLEVTLERAGVLCARAAVWMALYRRCEGEPPPAPLLPFVAAAAPAPADVPAPPPDRFAWRWRARYFRCHYSTHLQHSAWVAALEEGVDRFLEARGLSIRRMLQERGWIPVVSRVRVRLLGVVPLEADVETTFEVTDILRGLAYAGRMDGYLCRGDTRLHVASADILHGYAHAGGESAGRLATLDAETCQRLLGRSA